MTQSLSSIMTPSMGLAPPVAAAQSAVAVAPTHELRFEMLHHPGRALSFPCNAAGQVDFDRMSLKARENHARAVARLGLDYGYPQIRPTLPECDCDHDQVDSREAKARSALRSARRATMSLR